MLILFVFVPGQTSKSYTSPGFKSSPAIVVTLFIVVTTVHCALAVSNPNASIVLIVF